MAVKPILRLGDPRLHECARPVTHFDTPELRALLIDMRDTLGASKGAGLAAPQIGVSLQVVIFGIDVAACDAALDTTHFSVLINPILTPLADAFEAHLEGCLSMPGLRGLVPRYAQVRYRGYDLHGSAIDRSVSGVHARLVQHECDHLIGVLYPMRILDCSRFGAALEYLASSHDTNTALPERNETG